MSRKQEEQKKRKILLELEYPDLVSKLALLLGAGMTLQGAFRKIAGAYGQKRTQNKTAEMPAYEEMLVACRQMESGVGEQRAYEHFGERCGVASYRKLAGILTQNLQKGTRGITVLLEQEAQNAFEERKHAAKRYGEEAGTKLLFPMMLGARNCDGDTVGAGGAGISNLEREGFYERDQRVYQRRRRCGSCGIDSDSGRVDRAGTDL